mmetsp:Transcript_5633/g.21196  ORF Transcript_5633/g.21196 Transcript_5633/m.21196 type:complete len:293 (-) Transcript_5633:275-1153(-)
MCHHDLPCLWVFGYGSLIWRTGFSYHAKLNGYIQGFERKFRQVSMGHRGTSEFPGRVVTLLQRDNATDKIFGSAFCIKGENVAEVIESLDEREAGYDRIWTTVFVGDGLPAVQALVYVGKEENVSDVVCEYEIASIIARARGRSGPNCDYLYRLADQMRKWNVFDDHLETVCQLVQQIQAELNLTPCEISYRSAVSGTIVVHCRSSLSISNQGTPVCSCDIMRVEGTFQRGDIIEIRNKVGHLIAKGYSNYSSEKLDLIKGQPGEQIAQILGCNQGMPITNEVISKDSMVLC